MTETAVDVKSLTEIQVTGEDLKTALREVFKDVYVSVCAEASVWIGNTASQDSMDGQYFDVVGKEPTNLTHEYIYTLTPSK